jgi:hypothetical protein
VGRRGERGVQSVSAGDERHTRRGGGAARGCFEHDPVPFTVAGVPSSRSCCAVTRSGGRLSIVDVSGSRRVGAHRSGESVVWWCDDCSERERASARTCVECPS